MVVILQRSEKVIELDFSLVETEWVGERRRTREKRQKNLAHQQRERENFVLARRFPFARETIIETIHHHWMIMASSHISPVWWAAGKHGSIEVHLRSYLLLIYLLLQSIDYSQSYSLMSGDDERVEIRWYRQTLLVRQDLRSAARRSSIRQFFSRWCETRIVTYPLLLSVVSREQRERHVANTNCCCSSILSSHAENLLRDGKLILHAPLLGLDFFTVILGMNHQRLVRQPESGTTESALLCILASRIQFKNQAARST